MLATSPSHSPDVGTDVSVSYPRLRPAPFTPTAGR